MLSSTRRLLGTGPLDAAVRIDGERIIRADGGVTSVIAAGDLDVTSLDVDRASAVTSAIARLLRGLEAPLQIVVQSRLWETDDSATAAVEAAPHQHLLRAERAHRRTLVGRHRAMRRRILLLPTAPAADPRLLRRGVESVTAALAAATIEHRVLAAAELVELICESWGGDAPPPPHRALLELRPPPWESAAAHARSGHVYLRAVRLRRLPGVAVRTGWLAPLLRTEVESDVAVHLVPLDGGDAMQQLQRRLRGLRADQLVELDRDTLGNAAVEAGVDAALELRERLAHNLGRPLLLSLVAVARARDPGVLEPAAARLRTAMLSTLARGDVADLEHLRSAAATWPLGTTFGHGGKLVDSAAAGTCLPWVEAVCDDPGGYPLGRSLGSTTPVRVDPFDRGRHSNGNIAVIAASGRGKSYALAGIVLAATARGIASVILDPEAEYRGLVTAAGGEYIELGAGCATSLNIFDIAGSDAESHGEVAGAVVALSAVLCGGVLDDLERAHVDAAAHAALRGAGAQRRTPVLGDCLDHLGHSAPRVATVLARFCTGPLGELFNRPSSLRTDAQVIGVSLRDLREELVPAATLIVAEWLWALVRRDPRPRHIVVDEVGLLCAHAPLRSLLAQLARRCRKYSASLVVATQSAGDLLATEEGRVIATNAAIVLLGGQRGADTSLMQSAYSLTAAQRAFLESAPRGEFLLLAGQRRLGIAIDLSPEHHALITGG